MDHTIRVEKPDILADIPLDRSSVIEASAGTGKTYTLEHLIVELVVEKGLAISNILVVTFTEKATAELVERVRGIFQRLVQQEDGDADPDEPHWEIDAEKRRRLRDALFSFGRAPIYTIHGFCQRVLVEHAFANRRPFDQEHVESDELFDEVFHDALREEFARGPVMEALLQAYLGSNRIEDLRELLSEAAGSSDRVEPRADFETFEEWIEALEASLEQLDATTSSMLSVFEEVDAKGAMHGNKRDKAFRTLRAIRSGVEAARREGVGAFVREVLSIETDEPFDYLADDQIFNGAERERFDDVWIETLESVPWVESGAIPFVLDRFLSVIERRLDAYKSEHGVFTYDDMLEYVWAAVRESGELVETLRDEYEFALVDEFQDTDPVQWKIFERVFFESAGENPCALIGDPKQAIYGFRGADVRTYVEAKEQVQRAHGGDGAEPIRLPANYRSTPALIEAYNAILKPEDARLDEGTEFFTGWNSYEQGVVAGRPEMRFVGEGGREVAPIVVTSLHAPEGEEVRSDGFEGAIFRSWSREIAEMVQGDGDRDRFRITNDDGDLEPVGASDIFVLTRTKSQGDAFAKYLRAEGVPYAFYKREGLFQTPEARDWYELLHAVDRPGDRSRRLKAWATPFFELDLDEADEADQWVDENHELVERLNRWHRYARAGRVGQLVHSVLDGSGVLRRELFERHGRRELTNYEHLGESFVDWAQSDDLGVGEIVTRLGRYVDGEAAPEGEDANLQRLETDEEAVQILTMHKAKGLSAAVVFVFPGYQHGNQGPSRFYDEDGDRVLYFGSKGDLSNPGAVEAYTEQADERLLYVAMTRAEGRLYLPHIESDSRNWRAERARGPGGPLFDRFDALLEGDGGPEGFEVRRRAPDPTPPELADESRGRESGADLDLASVAGEMEKTEAALPKRERFGRLRADRRLFVESYSSVDDWSQREEGPETSDAMELDERAEPTGDEELEEEPEGPPLGRRTGLCIHQLLEDLDYGAAYDAEELEAWRRRGAVADRFDEVVAQFGMEEHRPELERLVWRALKASVRVDGLDLPSIAATGRQSKELEFWYPIPGKTGATLEELVRDGRPRGGERGVGYLRGFVDLVFEWEGRVYAADWKSNWRRGAEAYAPRDVEHAVDESYRIQELFYGVAAARLVARAVDGIEEFEEVFGGVLYLFVRGMELDAEPPAPGVYFRRPEFGELLEWEGRTGSLVEQKVAEKRDQIAEGSHDRWSA